MKNLTLSNIADACGAMIYHAPENDKREIAGAVIDSRQIAQDYLFFAVKGEKVDGHDYIERAFEAGAMAVICERIPEGCEGTLLLVEDTLKALRQVAEFYRKQLDIRVIGISGSVGKTTTKEFIAEVLSVRYKVLKTELNFNNEIGVPLMVLRIRDEHEIAVLEMGISDFGEMSRLAAITVPDICVITNIGQSHLEHLIDRDGIKRAKTEMFEYMNPNGEVVLFADDDKLAEIQEVNGKKPIFYGTTESADVKAIDIINRGLWGSICTIQSGEGEIHAEINLPGKHMVNNALAATAVGLLCGLSTDEIVTGISRVQSVAGRSNIMKTNDMTIIDDCYNANPASMEAAIELLGEAVGRKVAILGDMFELGENEAALHGQVGQLAVKKTDVLICIGALSKNMYEAALKEEPDALGRTYYFETKEAFMEKGAQILHQKDAVLIKASHGMQFGSIVEKLAQENFLGETKEMENEKDMDEANEEVRCEADDTVADAPGVEVEAATESGEEASAGNTENVDTGKTETKPTGKTEKLFKNANEAPLEKATGNGEETLESEAGKTAESSVDKKQKLQRTLMIVGVVVVIALLGVGIFLFANYQKTAELTAGILTYNKENSLLAVPSSSPVTYNDNIMITGEDSLTAEDWKSVINDTTVLAQSGKYIYYAKDYDISVKEYDLYYNKINGKTKNEELVDTRVSAYELDAKSNVFYLKKGDLYCYDAKEETSSLFTDKVEDFRLNEATDTVLYLSEGEMFLQKLEDGAKPISLDTGVTSIDEYAGDFATIIYHKDRALYLISGQNDVVRLSSCGELYTVTDLDKNYTICFANTEPTNPCITEFMKNDLKSGSDRDGFMSQLNETLLGMDTTQLCTFKKGDTTPEVIVPYLLSASQIKDSEDVIMIQQIALKKSDKVSVKRMYKDKADADTVYDAVVDSITNSEDMAIVREGKVMPFKKFEGGLVQSNIYDDGVSGVYFVAENEAARKDLYFVDYRWYAKGKTKLITVGIHELTGTYLSDPVYSISKDDGNVILYVGEAIVSASAAESTDGTTPRVTVDQKSLLYMGADDALYLYNKSVNEKIANNVSNDYVGISDKNIWYLKDYDDSLNEGDLCRYDGKETVADTCVFQIIYIYEE